MFDKIINVTNGAPPNLTNTVPTNTTSINVTSTVQESLMIEKQGIKWIVKSCTRFY